MSAAELRQAAETLRRQRDMVVLHPDVSAALADWLDHYAAFLAVQSPIAFADDSIALARLINGGAS